MENKKSQLLGIIATLLFHVVVIVILILWHFAPSPPPFPEPDGIMISFDNFDKGIGTPKMSTTSRQVHTVKAQKKVLTQNEEDVPAIQEEQQTTYSKTTPQTNNNNKQTQETQKINKNALYQSSNNSGSSGTTQGKGNQGTPDGNPNSNSLNNLGQGTNGISYSMKGRIAQSLPQPRYPPGNVAGKVVLNIKVDSQGNVIAVSLGQGSTTINKDLVREAKLAAWHAKFTPDATSIEQTGTITYIFKLR